MSPITTSFWPDLLAGSLCALTTLAYSSGFATLIFGGVLTPHAGQAVLAALVSSCVTTLVLSWRSSFFFAIGGPDSNPSAILAVTVAAISASVPGEGIARAELLPTALMFLFVSAGACGLLLYVVGQRGWGRYVRYIPHQVMSGFLLGTGYLLLIGGWKMITGAAPFHTTTGQLTSVPPIAWITAAGVSAALLLFTRGLKHYLVIPTVIFGGILIFHVGLRLGGDTPDLARASGLLLEPLDFGAWNHPFNQSWGDVRWNVILRQTYDFAAMSSVVLITILLNATNLDNVLGRDADFDGELKALGVANILSALCGGLVAVNSFNRSLLNLRAGARSPWAARISVALVVALICLAPSTVGLIPKPVLAGLVIYLGLSLFLQSLWDGRGGMPIEDYLIMLAILGTVVVLGIVPGVVVGILASTLSFVVNLSRTAVVKHRFTGVTRLSNVERPARDIDWLRNHGELLQGATLHGHLFFGTSNTVLDQLRESLQRARVLTLDFWQVRGIDASSVMVLRKLLKLAADSNVQMVFTGLSKPIRDRITACGLDLSTTPVRVFPDLDHGLEWAEELLLVGSLKSTALAEVLGGLSSEEQITAERYFETRRISPGETFIRRGDSAELLFIVLEGRVSIYLPIPGSDYRKRLRSYGSGTIVGEMGFYSGETRSADISADAETRLACIDRRKLATLEVEHPAVACRLHHLVVQTLATRLRAANSAIADLL